MSKSVEYRGLKCGNESGTDVPMDFLSPIVVGYILKLAVEKPGSEDSSLLTFHVHY